MLGGGLGILLILAGRSVGLTDQALPAIQIGWILLVFVGWGGGLNWAYRKLVHTPPREAANNADPRISAI